jgi:NAD-dependent deacetylase
MTTRDFAEATTVLAEALADPGDLLLVVTGAGVSLASGIPTFRGTDPGAVWKRDLTELATFEFFRRDPVESWRWYLDRFDLVRDARPNPGHRALAAIERARAERRPARQDDASGGRDTHDARSSGGEDFLLVTQNIDTLHEAAGSRRLVKVHGSADRVRCSAVRCRLGAPGGSLPFGRVDAAAFLADPCWHTLPRCPECEAPLRPHVLWFDEFYGDHDDYQWNRLLGTAAAATTILFVGTSFSVGVTDVVLQSGLATGAAMISIDPGAHRQPHGRLRHLAVPAEEVLPAACRFAGLPVE